MPANTLPNRPERKLASARQQQLAPQWHDERKLAIYDWAAAIEWRRRAAERAKQAINWRHLSSTASVRGNCQMKR